MSNMRCVKYVLNFKAARTVIDRGLGSKVNARFFLYLQEDTATKNVYIFVLICMY